MSVERRSAHARDPRQLFDAEGLVVAAADDIDRAADLREVTGRKRELPQHFSPGAEQQAIENLAFDERTEHRNVSRPVEEAKQSQDRIEQFVVELVYRECFGGCAAGGARRHLE